MSAVGAIFPRSASAPPQQFANLSARALEPSAVFVLPFDALRRALAIDLSADAERSLETLRRLVQSLVVRLYRVTFLALYKYLALSEQLLDTVRPRHVHRSRRAAHPPTTSRDLLLEPNCHFCFRRTARLLSCSQLFFYTRFQLSWRSFA